MMTTPSHSEAFLELAADYQRLLDALADGADTDEALDAVLAEFKVVEGAVEAAVGQLARMDALVKSQIAAGQAIIDHARTVQARYERQHESLRRFLLGLFQRAGLQKVRTEIGTVYVTRHERVVVDDPALVPDTLMRVTVAANLTAIKAALAEGESIAGVHTERSESIAIR
mgnify:CR=1 FL=1